MKTAGNIIISIVCVFIAVCFLIIVPQLFGVSMKTVISGSMEPYIPVGSLAVIKPCDASELTVGDDVTYKLPSGIYVTHRIVGKDDKTGLIQTQGIANDIPDVPIYADIILGKVIFSVPLAGYAVSFLSTLTGKICTGIALLSLMAIAMLLNYAAKTSKDNENGAV